MSGRKFMHLVANIHQGFHFRSTEQLPMGIVTVVQRNDSDRITRHHPEIFVLVIQAKSIHATEFFEEIRTLFKVQRQDHFTVGLRAKWVTAFKPCPDLLVIVDFTINRQRLACRIHSVWVVRRY